MADEYLTAALYGMKRFNEGASKKVKELMGMEKLIELLNEYETPQSGVVFKSYDNYDGTFYGVDCDGETEIAWSDSLIISKKFGFIQRLLNNQGIDQEKLDHSLDSCFHINNDVAGSCIKLTMYLAIQDNPIEFLVSILK